MKYIVVYIFSFLLLLTYVLGHMFVEVKISGKNEVNGSVVQYSGWLFIPGINIEKTLINKGSWTSSPFCTQYGLNAVSVGESISYQVKIIKSMPGKIVEYDFPDVWWENNVNIANQYNGDAKLRSEILKLPKEIVLELHSKRLPVIIKSN